MSKTPSFPETSQSLLLKTIGESHNAPLNTANIHGFPSFQRCDSRAALSGSTTVKTYSACPKTRDGHEIHNEILLSLPKEEQDLLFSQLEFVRLTFLQTLHDVGDSIKSAYFCNSGMEVPRRHELWRALRDQAHERLASDRVLTFYSGLCQPLQRGHQRVTF